MSKTLVVAEKPSVARDLASTLPGSFKQSKDKTHLEGEDYVITWTVGHLVGLADPEVYDPKLKKWRFADLPIVPERFKLVPNDERARKQLSVLHRLMRDEETELIVNACDAGREGELIFAYVLEAAARSRSEADWVVGMNATRAASIRLRAAFDGAVSLGRVQTPTLALVVRREQEIRDFVPEPYWLVEARVATSGASGCRARRRRRRSSTPSAARRARSRSSRSRSSASSRSSSTT